MMAPLTAQLARHRDLDQEVFAALAEPAKSRYAIRLTRTPSLYAAQNQKWLERDGALTFEFVSTANRYAMEWLGLGVDEFAIETCAA